MTLEGQAEAALAEAMVRLPASCTARSVSSGGSGAARVAKGREGMSEQQREKGGLAILRIQLRSPILEVV